MNIAICDDSREERRELRDILEKLQKDAVITECEDGQELLDIMAAGTTFDLVFADIFMNQVGGLEISRAIHRLYSDTEVVLVSFNREFGPEAFEVNAFYYLVKPYEEEQVKKVMKRFGQMNQSQAEIYDANSRRRRKIPFRKITYIESMHNYLYIHMVSEAVLKVRGSLQDFQKQLDDRFLRINRGVIVNMEAVEKMNTDSCEIDGMIFMLSRRQRTENRKKYNDYLFRHYMDD